MIIALCVGGLGPLGGQCCLAKYSQKQKSLSNMIYFPPPNRIEILVINDPMVMGQQTDCQGYNKISLQH